MPTRNVNLTEHQDQFVGEVLAAGRYQNASEVVRDGLRLLERREREDAAKLARLRVAVEEAEGAVARGEYEDVADNQLTEWLSNLGTSGRGSQQP